MLTERISKHIGSVHTPTMTLTILALIGIVLPTVLLAVGFIDKLLSVVRNMALLLTSLVHLLASLN